MIINMQDKAYEERLQCLGQDLIEVFKMFRGFSKVSLQELFMLDVNSKGTRGTRANWLRPGALGILPSTFLK